MIPTTVDSTVTPALGDLNHDGVPDIVTVDTTGHLYAFDHTGTVLFGPGDVWGGTTAAGTDPWYSGAIALADLDHDGHVEIIGGNSVWNDQGHLLWTAPTTEANWNATTAADLDGDGMMEVVLGHAAYHHDGTLDVDDEPAARLSAGREPRRRSRARGPADEQRRPRGDRARRHREVLGEAPDRRSGRLRYVAAPGDRARLRRRRHRASSR